MYRIKVIYNPRANRGRNPRDITELREIARTLGASEWIHTEYPGHAILLAAQAAREGYQRVVSIGGDGTLHEIVNGLLQIPDQERPQLGIVPMGSGNDFVVGVGATSNIRRAIEHVFDDAHIRRIDAGFVRFGDGAKHYWCNMLGIGFDAAVTLQSQHINWLRGQAMYFLAAVRTIIENYDAPEMIMELDGSPLRQRVQMLTIGNGTREGGGFITTPDAQVDDGRLDYAMFQPVSRAMMVRLIPEVMRGTHGRFHQVRMGKIVVLKLQADRPLLIHADGEMLARYSDNVTVVEVGIVPGALTLVS
ncbi:MAG: diacylglycerol kinase family lipid kinase [Chloroflexi bacterium]|nr:diacylglycerol kinase family lipid kinase [Chloroflexota bacterium]